MHIYALFVFAFGLLVGVIAHPGTPCNNVTTTVIESTVTETVTAYYRTPVTINATSTSTVSGYEYVRPSIITLTSTRFDTITIDLDSNSETSSVLSSTGTGPMYFFHEENGTTYWLSGAQPASTKGLIIGTTTVQVVPSPVTSSQQLNPTTIVVTEVETIIMTVTTEIFISSRSSFASGFPLASRSFAGTGVMGWNTTSSTSFSHLGTGFINASQSSSESVIWVTDTEPASTVTIDLSIAPNVTLPQFTSDVHVAAVRRCTETSTSTSVVSTPVSTPGRVTPVIPIATATLTPQPTSTSQCAPLPSTMTMLWDTMLEFGQRGSILPLPNPYDGMYFEPQVNYVPSRDVLVFNHTSNAKVTDINAVPTVQDGTWGSFGAGPYINNPNFAFNVDSIMLGCEDDGVTFCEINLFGLWYNQTSESPDQIMIGYFNVTSCSGVYGCAMFPFDLSGVFLGVSEVRLQATVNNVPRTFYMGALEYGYVNNTCAGQEARDNAGSA